MKTLILLFTCFMCKAQIETKSPIQYIKVGEASQGLVKLASIDYVTTDSSTIYFMAFRDMQYQKLIEYKIVTFEGNRTLSDLYNILLTGVNQKDYGVDFKLGDSDIRVRGGRMLGSNYVDFCMGKAWVRLSEKNVNRLFGRD